MASLRPSWPRAKSSPPTPSPQASSPWLPGRPVGMHSEGMSSSTSAGLPACIQAHATYSCSLEAVHQGPGVLARHLASRSDMGVSRTVQMRQRRACMSGQAHCSAGCWTTAARCLSWSRQRAPGDLRCSHSCSHTVMGCPAVHYGALDGCPRAELMHAAQLSLECVRHLCMMPASVHGSSTSDRPSYTRGRAHTGGSL